LSSVLVAATLGTVLPLRLNTEYYHMIDNADYRTFLWVRDNLDPAYRRAVLDPWQGVPFAALSGRFAYTYIGEFAQRVHEQVNKFLADGCRDTAFLTKNNITLVYSRSTVDNPALVEVMPNLYVLRLDGKPGGAP
jgi:hypothetical protein